ncbi:MAG TPA: hypothetical protein VF278_07590 [Pirellulales bacterium]
MKVPPLILNSLDDTGRSLLRADAATNDPRSEAWLQELLYAHPELLPVDEFGESFSPPIPVGREVPTNAGPIDNLFVSPLGGMTNKDAQTSQHGRESSCRSPDELRDAIV